MTYPSDIFLWASRILIGLGIWKTLEIWGWGEALFSTDSDVEQRTHEASLVVFQNETSVPSSPTPQPGIWDSLSESPIGQITIAVTKPIRFGGKAAYCLTKSGMSNKAACLLGLDAKAKVQMENKAYIVSFIALLALLWYLMRSDDDDKKKKRSYRYRRSDIV